MKPPLVADTGGLLRALARRRNGQATWPDYESALQAAAAIIVPALVLAELDYFLRQDRTVMRQIASEIFDPATRYEFEPATPSDIVRALQIDAKFGELELGLVDGTVAAVAERRGVFRVLTADRADFSVIRVGSRYQRALTLLP